MGCISSKIMRRSGSFQEELSQSLQRRTRGFEELLISKNGGDQFLALLCTANTVARKLKAHEPDTNTNAPLELTNPINIKTQEEPDRIVNPPIEVTNSEIINAWELMADLEEDKEEEEEEEGQKQQEQYEAGPSNTIQEYNSTIPSKNSNEIKENSEGGVTRTRSFRTVEDYNAMVGGNHSFEGGEFEIESSRRNEEFQLPEGSGSLIKECSMNLGCLHKVEEDGLEHVDLRLESTGVKGNAELRRSSTSRNGSRRKAMAKELSALKVPSFQFSRTGSLREWLVVGGQTFSPGSYITPKFSNFVPMAHKNGDTGGNDAVFDPEMVAHFEEAMEQLTMEEEHILKQIVDSLQEGNVETIENFKF